MTLSIERVRELLTFFRRADRECGLACPGFVIMERGDNGLLEIETCDVCARRLKNGMELFDGDVAQLPEARELFRRERAQIRGAYQRRLHARSWSRLLSKQDRSNFMRNRSRARADLNLPTRAA